VVLILNQGLSFYINATQTFKASMADEPRGEELRVRLETSTGRPTLLERLLRQAKNWVTAYIVDGAERTNAETGVIVSVTGTNVAATAHVDYYIEGRETGGGGTPYRFLEGNGTAVTVGGDALDVSNQTTIESHLEAMGLSTTQSWTIDYYVYVTARATGAVSGETLTTEIQYTKFDTVNYGYGTLVTDVYQVVNSDHDGYIQESGSTYDSTNEVLRAGDHTSSLSDYQCWQRFNDVEVTQGTELVMAKLQWKADYRDGAPTVIVVGDDSDHAIHPTSLSDFLSKPRTNATASDTPTDWVPGTWYAFYITDVAQEIIDRPGWQSGNNMQFFVEDDTEGWGGAEAWLGADSYDENPADAPKLRIKYVSYGASWYNIPPLSVVDLPVTLDVVAVLAVVATTAFIVQTKRRRNEK